MTSASAIRSIGILVNTAKPAALELLPRLINRADQIGVRLVSCQTLGDQADGIPRVDRSAFAGQIDALVTLGGDGTLLQAVHFVQKEHLPILGINLGRMGFLTGAGAGELEAALDALVAGTYRVSERVMLDAVILNSDGAERGRARALNDMVVGWGQSTRIVTLDVAIDDEPVTSYRCDGIIISTPTGSTGHSLSAGGPIVHPQSASLVLNVVCPHTLSARPLVVPDSVQVKIVVKQTGKKLLLSADGQDTESLTDGDSLIIQKAEHRFRLVHLSGYRYFGVLREKLQWSGSSA